jgi:hypothetical protein
LDRYPQVGILKEEEKAGRPMPDWLEGLLERLPILRRHPHPMVVHFPLAFLMASSLFVLLHLLFKNPSFETTSFYLLLLGTSASPFAMAQDSLPGG